MGAMRDAEKFGLGQQQQSRLEKGGGGHLFNFLKQYPDQHPAFQSITPRFLSQRQGTSLPFSIDE